MENEISDEQGLDEEGAVEEEEGAAEEGEDVVGGRFTNWFNGMYEKQ